MMATIAVVIKLQLTDCQKGLIAALKNFWSFCLSASAHIAVHFTCLIVPLIQC